MDLNKVKVLSELLAEEISKDCFNKECGPDVARVSEEEQELYDMPLDVLYKADQLERFDNLVADLRARLESDTTSECTKGAILNQLSKVSKVIDGWD